MQKKLAFLQVFLLCSLLSETGIPWYQRCSILILEQLIVSLLQTELTESAYP